jgi:hypothetical protein
MDWSEMGLRNEDGYKTDAVCRRCQGEFGVTILLSYSFVIRRAGSMEAGDG